MRLFIELARRKQVDQDAPLAQDIERLGRDIQIWLWLADRSYRNIVDAVERAKKSGAGKRSAEARAAPTRAKIRAIVDELNAKGAARHNRVSFISKRTGLRDHDQIRKHLRAIEDEDAKKKPG